MTRLLQFSKDDSFCWTDFYTRAHKTSPQEQAVDNFIFQCPLLPQPEEDLGGGTSASGSSTFLTTSHLWKTPGKAALQLAAVAAVPRDPVKHVVKSSFILTNLQKIYAETSFEASLKNDVSFCAT